MSASESCIQRRICWYGVHRLVWLVGSRWDRAFALKNTSFADSIGQENYCNMVIL